MTDGLLKLGFKLAVIFMVMLAAASCGRRGNPEAPPSASVIAIDENGNELPSAEEEPVEDKPFILDPLL